MIDSLGLTDALSNFLSANIQRGNAIIPAYNTEIDPYANFTCLEKATLSPLH